MATAATSSANAHSYTEMRGDVEAIGSHCQLEYCHVLDFLPFRCESCKGTYCLDHRSETDHKCPKAGEWARKRAGRDLAGTPSAPKPSLYDHDQQCYDKSCKTLINTSRMPANLCSTCRRSYCLKHRMPEDHDCKNVKPPGLGARQGNILQQQREKGVSALAKLKAWAAVQREKKEAEQTKKRGFLGLGKSNSAAAREQAEINALKKVAKGDASVPQDKRIYLAVEASADTTKAKYPTGKFYYNKDWTVGRVLDMAAKSLQVQNVNNRGGGEEEKLRVFHVEGGRLLKFSEKVGDACKTGNMIVLLRGVGSGEPDLIDLTD